MATFNPPQEIQSVQETPVIPEATVQQLKLPQQNIKGVQQAPTISLIGASRSLENILLESAYQSQALAHRKRSPDSTAIGDNETKVLSNILFTPEKCIPTGKAFFRSKHLNNQYIDRGTLAPINYIIDGDRLENTEVSFIVCTTKSSKPFIEKREFLGVVDNKIQPLGDDREQISGTIVLTPSDTMLEKSIRFLECKYSIFLYNNNVRKYLIESGIITFR